MRENMNEILNQLPIGIFIVNTDFKITYYNKVFKKYFSPNINGIRVGEVLNCADRGSAECGKGIRCNSCGLRHTLQNVINNNERIYNKELVKEFIPQGIRKNLNLCLTVKPFEDKKLYLGIIEKITEVDINLGLEKDLEQAKKIQTKLLPNTREYSNAYVDYFYKPRLDIGGDLLAVYEVDNLTNAYIADVSGSGIAGAMLTSFIKVGFDEKIKNVNETLNLLFSNFKKLKMDEKAYITLQTVSIDRENKLIYYSQAGHNAPMLLKRGNIIVELNIPSPPISNWFESCNYELKKVSFDRGDVLLMLTDGVIEVTNFSGESFGIDRVKDILRNQKPENVLKVLFENLNDFAEYPDDDMTAMMIMMKE